MYLEGKSNDWEVVCVGVLLFEGKKMLKFLGLFYFYLYVCELDGKNRILEVLLI